MKSAPIAVDSPDGTNLLPDNIDAITRTLLPRYQEVAREMAPFRQRTIYEANADLSFFQMNEGRPDALVEVFGEGTAGAAERCWKRSCPASLRIIDAEVPGASPSHLLDAARDPLDRQKDLCQGRRPHPE